MAEISLLAAFCLCRLCATLFERATFFVCVRVCVCWCVSVCVCVYWPLFLFAHSLFMLSPFALACFIYLVNLFMLTNCAKPVPLPPPLCLCLSSLSVCVCECERAQHGDMKSGNLCKFVSSQRHLFRWLTKAQIGALTIVEAADLNGACKCFENERVNWGCSAKGYPLLLLLMYQNKIYKTGKWRHK